MSKVYVVKYERELDNVDDVVYVTTDKSKAEEIVETFISVDMEFVGDVVETIVKDLCWIEEYPLDVIIPDIDEVN
jgi:DNA-binding transcriptional regulator WhiA